MKRLLAALALADIVAPVWPPPETSHWPFRPCKAPVTVKEALSKVPDIGKIAVSLAKKDAIVTFDDSKTTVAALTQATRNAGYPSTVER